jgi:hypothetical protein
MKLSYVGLGLVPVILAVAGCVRDRSMVREIYDSRTEAQLRAAAEESKRTIGDTADLYRRDLSRGTALLDHAEGVDDPMRDWSALRDLLTAAYDHSTEMRERLIVGGGIADQEINAMAQHGAAQAELNRAWVRKGNKTASPDAYLANLGQPKPWSREPLSSRLGVTNFRGALENERVHLYNYAGLVDQLVEVAKGRGIAGADYWASEGRGMAGAHAVVEADVIAMRQGVSLSEPRVTAAWDMAHASRVLMAYRLPFAFGAVRLATERLTPEQAATLQGKNFMDGEALAAFRGFFLEARTKQAAGLLDSNVDGNPAVLATAWWCFRAIPSNFFKGKGDYVLPAAVTEETDGALLTAMVDASQPQLFVPRPPPSENPQEKASAQKTTATASR